MIRAFRNEIEKWKKTQYPKIVVLTKNFSSKAFSAGGDIKDIYNAK